jgi:threonyl-tRNA synthetase
MNNENLHKVRHSLAHLTAAAVLKLWPDTKITIGPVIENGFYYDFDFSSPISDEDLGKIEKTMREMATTWGDFEKLEVTPEEAKDRFKNNPYKMELIEEFIKEGSQITLYKSGDFVDLCEGGHVQNVKEINFDAFKLTHIAGAYWRGNENNKMLTRVYGLAFETKEELDAYVVRMEEAKKRDHKKLGKELDLFTFSGLVGPGLPLWTPKGTVLRNILDDFVWELRKAQGYEKVEIPHITKKELYEMSGHWAKFQDELFKINTREGHLFAMKPMNCPHHTQIYDRKPHSYRELPQRYANTTTCYRDEQTGELSGLARVRAFTQDDAHVFCRMKQTKKEFLKIWDIVHEFYAPFGFDLKVRLSRHDPEHFEKFLGDPKRWVKAEKILKDIVDKKGIEYIDGLGEAAFYGPKLDFLAEDSLGREWQVATIQLDLNMPKSFDLTCTNEKGEKERIVMIHAAIMGSIERFLAIAIEHFAGAFPLWLSPVQVDLITVSEKHIKRAESLAKKLGKKDIRVEVDDSNETVGKKIREAKLRKTPYVLVIGDREIESDTLAVNQRGAEAPVKIEMKEFIKKLTEKIKKRELEL